MTKAVCRPIEGLMLQEEAAQLVARYSVFAPSGCVLWSGPLDRDGYGQKKVRGRMLRAHRVAYFAVYGDTDLPLDHLCRNPRCVNADHLEAVSGADNTLRGVSPSALNARKTHCVRGHLLSETAVINVDGARKCRVCTSLHTRNYRSRIAIRRAKDD